MSIPAKAIPDPSPGVLSESRDFRRRVGTLTRRFVDLWWQGEAEFPDRAPVSQREKRDNEDEVEKAISRIGRQIDRLPASGDHGAAWRSSLRDSLRDLGQRRFGDTTGYSKELFSDASFDVTASFLEEARSFSPAIEIEDLYQALRNVWIVNSIQLFRGEPISYSPAIFAYSMLYPYTDNHLDDEAIDFEAKQHACDRLRRRLAGVPLEALSPREADVFRLVGMIEDHFPRRDFSVVFDSLLAIHSAQERSLRQHGRSSPYEVDLLSISVEKGGTSVLADAYLVSGRLDPLEEEFHFGYGFLLQLLDDLQDVEIDRTAGHQTMFSQTSSKFPLDGVLNRLFGFMDRTLGLASCFPSAGAGAAHDLISKNCSLLLLQAVAENQDSFTQNYTHRLEETSPVSFRFLRAQARSLEKRVRRLRKRLNGRGGLEAMIAFRRRSRTAPKR